MGEAVIDGALREGTRGRGALLIVPDMPPGEAARLPLLARIRFVRTGSVGMACATEWFDHMVELIPQAASIMVGATGTVVGGDQLLKEEEP
ncbi:hypothetical protein ACIGEP_07235 [Microbacterium sp. NPDC077663]|uniref:hypothetical protein n=1 Tax=Microbacterium sp. NPDC077663 TaxID=3364189 RepID=UPI0037C6549F